MAASKDNINTLVNQSSPIATSARPIAKIPSAFSSLSMFENVQRMAKLLSASDMIPEQYRGNLPNTVIALEMANRIGASALAVMQNLYIVHGKPSWSSQFIIASLNSCGRYSPLRFELLGDGDQHACFAWCYDLDNNNERIEGPTVSIGMAKAEGWFQKKGSKWQTMPEVMLRYRAASFFGKLYAPEIMMGMQSSEELNDIIDLTPNTYGEFETAPKKGNAGVKAKLKTYTTKDQEAEPVDAIVNGVDISTGEVVDDDSDNDKLKSNLKTKQAAKKASTTPASATNKEPDLF